MQPMANEVVQLPNQDGWRTALTGAGLGTEKRALTLGMNLRWIAAAVLRSLYFQ